MCERKAKKKRRRKFENVWKCYKMAAGKNADPNSIGMVLGALYAHPLKWGWLWSTCRALIQIVFGEQFASFFRLLEYAYRHIHSLCVCGDECEDECEDECGSVFVHKMGVLWQINDIWYTCVCVCESKCETPILSQAKCQQAAHTLIQPHIDTMISKYTSTLNTRLEGHLALFSLPFLKLEFQLTSNMLHCLQQRYYIYTYVCVGA